MSSPSLPALQQLDRLNRSLPNFHDQLNDIIHGQEYIQCVPDLRVEDLAWLVDYLDEVRRRVVLPYSPLKPQQALGALDPSSPASRKCLRELRSICGARAVLPTSYTLSSDTLNIGPDPFASGGYGDVYQGTLNGSTVSVKRVRVYLQDGPQKVAKVRF